MRSLYMVRMRLRHFMGKGIHTVIGTYWNESDNVWSRVPW